MLSTRALHIIGLSVLSILSVLLVLQRNQIHESREALHQAAVETLQLDTLLSEVIRTSDSSSLRMREVSHPLSTTVRPTTSLRTPEIVKVSPTKSSEFSIPVEMQRTVIKKRAILFTMDSITSCKLWSLLVAQWQDIDVENSKRGGAAGEILIRRCLETAFEALGIRLDVKHSDGEFEQADMTYYDIIILDPWTWAMKGWVPKHVIRGHESKIFILDFFGSPNVRSGALAVPPHRILTAFGSPWNTFLGFYLNTTVVSGEKLLQGVIWGKDPKHFSGRSVLLAKVADRVELHSTATERVLNHPNIRWDGHQTPSSWSALLASSKFLLGLGDPLLGPSAIDAIAAGCVYINPIYSNPVRGVFRSQHDYAMEKIGTPYVCSARLENVDEVLRCVDTALSSSLAPHVPDDFQYNRYLERVKRIFLSGKWQRLG